jgi:hypothetical protein
MTKNIYEEVTQTIDKETGEIEEVKRHVRRKIPRDKFAMIYVEEIVGLLEKTSPSETRVLVAILQDLQYNTNKIFLTKGVKERIATETDLKYGTVQNTIYSLNRKKILIRENSSEYLLNPNYFFKGEEIERAKVLKLVIEYHLTD